MMVVVVFLVVKLWVSLVLDGDHSALLLHMVVNGLFVGVSYHPEYPQMIQRWWLVLEELKTPV